MLLALDFFPILMLGLFLWMPMNTMNGGWKFTGTFLMTMILIGMVPLSSSFMSLVPLVGLFSLTLWVTSVLLRFIPYSKSHIYYVPSGVSYPLIPLLYLLEILSDFIRPIALTVRIVVNLSLGHLFIHGSASPLFGVGLVIILLFELAVAFIQGYIYTTLPSLW
uniref:ATP synthase subunit a n=1 Tax=Thetys vagina TaxID=942565 RepID=A0AA86M5F9_9UROC|nr:ATP synthase F0 subunit 6 [Thetys vagina]